MKVHTGPQVANTVSQNPMSDSECIRDLCCDAVLGVLELLEEAAICRPGS